MTDEEFEALKPHAQAIADLIEKYARDHDLSPAKAAQASLLAATTTFVSVLRPNSLSLAIAKPIWMDTAENFLDSMLAVLPEVWTERGEL